MNRVRIDADKRTLRSLNYWFRPSSVLKQEHNKWRQSIFKLHPNSTEGYSRLIMADGFTCKRLFAILPIINYAHLVFFNCAPFILPMHNENVHG